ncbi:sensor histidine kinase [Tessaracoccus sp. SD287]|uniref:sensor histidine kinase n=1 Tax=Tessaracoccus sp. SD287 TaxID=2782008 RepID=UPI001A96AF57|nr:sensor histidine kinase [Tessaracoccus sp. SD287]MBO1030834.1 sensor histidine kinase [Tessaracoccus sp. SD287]
MSMLSQSMLDHTTLEPSDQQWLRDFVNEWQMLADTSFSDLILWVPDADESIFWAAAQTRPSTGPTALEDDVVGDSIHYDPEHLVTEAFLSETICETSDNQLRSGIPVDVWAIPILRHGRVIAIVERHTNRMGVRAPGALEDAYLETADALSVMAWQATYPVQPASDPSISPQVGDGMILLSVSGIISYATPNAVSVFRRLGWAGDMEGEDLRQISLQILNSSKQIGQTVVRDLTGQQVREFDLETDEASSRIRVVPLVGLEGPSGTMVMCSDTTELRHRDRALVTKDATIREIHHRVKNNLQTVAALLRLQARRIESPEAKRALKDAMGRVQAIAVVHEILSRTFDEDVPFDDVVDKILQMVGDVSAATNDVRARRDGDFGMVPAGTATSLSVVITELCQNAVEHGLGRATGTVTVRPTRRDKELEVAVIDQGLGITDPEAINGSKSLGLSIVRTLVSDLGGTFDLSNNPGDEPGARAVVRIPI